MMIYRDACYLITKFKGKTIAVAVGAIFSLAGGRAMATDYAANTVLAVDPNAVVNFTADVVVSVNNTVNLGSNTHFTTATNNTGTLTLVGATALTGNIGTAATSLKLFTVGNAAASALGNIYATTTNFAADNTLEIDAQKTFVTNFTTATNGTGTITLGTGTAGVLTGNIGAADKKLAVFNVDRDFTVNGSIYATAVFVSNGRALTFTGGTMGSEMQGAAMGVGTANFSGSSTLNTAMTGNSLGQLNFTGGTSTISADMRATDTTISGTSTLRIGAAGVDFTDPAGGGSIFVKNTATLDLATYSNTTVAGNFYLQNSATIRTTINSGAANDNGKVTANVFSAFVNTGTKVHVTVARGISIANGTQYMIIDGAAGTNVQTLAAGDITDNSAVLSFTQVANTQDLIIQAVRSATTTYSTAAGLAPASSGYSAGTSLNNVAISGAATGDMATVIGTFDGYSESQLATEVVKLAPINNTPVAETSHNVATGGLNNVANRVAALRGETQFADGGFGTGLAAGNGAMSRHFWAKGFGSWSEAGRRGGFNGYETSGGGLSLGADTETNAGWTVGGALTYAATDLKHRDLGAGDNNQIKSYQLTGYTTRDWGSHFFDAMVAFTRHDNDARRTTALSRTATGDFDANQWSTRIASGYRIPLQGKTVLTPLASLELSRLTQDAYTEKGAGALSLSYEKQTWDTVKLGLGARLTGEARWGATTVLPEAHVIAYGNFGDRRVDTTASFTGGGAAFTTAGQRIQRGAHNVGGSLAFVTGETSKVTLAYDYEGRSNFTGHSVQLTGRWLF